MRQLITPSIFFFFLQPIIGMDNAPKKEKLPIQASVKLANGDFTCITYNPYCNGIAQEFKTSHGIIKTPTFMFFLDSVPGLTKTLKDVDPRGFIVANQTLIGIARATHTNPYDAALFFIFNTEMKLISNAKFNSLTIGHGEILDIKMSKTVEGNLKATLHAKRGSAYGKIYALFKGSDISRFERTWLKESPSDAVNKQEKANP